MPDPLVTIAHFRDLPEALLAKGALESSGINCFLIDDNVVRMDWFYANAIGGIRLQVEELDVGSAQEILHLPIPERLQPNGVEYVQPRCPQCKSLNVGYAGISRFWSYLLMYCGFPLPIPARYWRCSDCGARWKWQGPGDYDDQPVNDGQENQN